MSFFKKQTKPLPQKHWKIKRKCLQLILEAAKASYPKEFGGLLRVDTSDKETIIEIVLLPGTISGDEHAIFQLHMLPIDFSIVGTVHSHPSSSARPSDADRQLFEKFGVIHLSVAEPFTESSWKAYLFTGEEIPVAIV